jgi:hypothetical protein
LPGAHFEAGVEREGLQRPALVREGDEAARGRGGLQGDAEQRQELEAVALGNLVAAVEQVLRQEGEDFDERDAGVAAVEVRPLGVVDGDARQRLAEQVLVFAVVDGRNDKRHERSLPFYPARVTPSDTRSRDCVATSL